MADLQPSLASHLAGAVPAALLLLVPFEPRAPAFTLGPVAVTTLEAAAAVGTIILLVHGRARLGSALRSGPVRGAWALAAAHALSAVLAADTPGLAFKFSLRMAAMALAATAFATCGGAAATRGLRALVVAGFAVSALAVGEGVGLRALEPMLALFREMPFNVGGVRRASAGSEYPNLAAALLMVALVTAGGLSAAGGRGRAWALAGPKGQPDGDPALRWIVFAVVAAIVLLVVILAVRVLLRSRAAGPAVATSAPIGSTRDEDPLSRGASEWERYAGELAAARQYRQAIRAWYHAVLVTCYAAGILHFRKGRTNWEYVASLAPSLTWRPDLIELTRRFEKEWYGADQSTADALEECSERAERILDTLRREMRGAA